MAKIIIGVMGGGENASAADKKNAYELGRFCAKQGWVTLTGGRNVGVMDEALRGAKEESGLTIGIMPSEDKNTYSKHADIQIITNMRSGRNYINALTSSILIACGMGPGTSSEVSLAINAGKRIILIGTGEETNTFYKSLALKQVLTAKDYNEAIEILRKEHF